MGTRTVSDFLDEAGISGYGEALASETLAGMLERLEVSRPAFLKSLADLGVSKLADRQAIANKLGKAKREGRL